MQALEFSSVIEQGIIRLPKKYQKYDNSYARIIILIEEPHQLSAKKEKLRKTFQKMENANMFSKIFDPTSWQKQIRDEWE